MMSPTSSVKMFFTAVLLALSSASRPPFHPAQGPDLITIPATPANTTSQVEFTLNDQFFLDNPKVSPVNETVFDWWYFDAVNTNLASGDLSSVAIVFYTSSNQAFIDLQAGEEGVLISTLTGTFRNGTAFNLRNLPATGEVAKDGGFGNWGEGREFERFGWGREYVVSWNDSSSGVSGTLRLTPHHEAPAHLPCTADLEPGASEEILPHVGWSNALPDGDASVSFTFSSSNSTTTDILEFDGAGYHDKNWGDQPFFASVSSGWYWGHVRLGPYSLVYFDALTITGAEHFSSYLYSSAGNDNKTAHWNEECDLLNASCANGTAIARPWGGEDTYPPPSKTLETPLGFVVSFPEVEGRGEFKVNITIQAVTLQAPGVYTRWIGSVTGGFVGEEQYEGGVAQLEQFSYTASS